MESSNQRIGRKVIKKKHSNNRNNNNGNSSSSSSGSSNNINNNNVDNNGEPIIKVICNYKFVIISYALVPNMIDTLEDLKFNVIIADECHYLKNALAARTKSLVLLLKQSNRAVLLSGTPALSRPMELFTQLNALEPLAWPDMKAFGKR